MIAAAARSQSQPAIDDQLHQHGHDAHRAAYALTDAKAREALQRYLALPSGGPETIASFKALEVRVTDLHGGPRFPESWDRVTKDVRKAGMP